MLALGQRGHDPRHRGERARRHIGHKGGRIGGGDAVGHQLGTGRRPPVLGEVGEGAQLQEGGGIVVDLQLTPPADRALGMVSQLKAP